MLSDLVFGKHEGYNEKNLAGDDQEYIEFVMAAPYILVGFLCYVIDLIKRRRQQLMQMLEGNSGDQVTSLTTCFEQSGLKPSDTKKKVITYAMAEQAIFFFKSKNRFGSEQLEMVLRQVKEYMNVGQLDRLEQEKLTFKHKWPNKCFGRWLTQKIGLQIIWKEITKQQK